MPRVTEKKRILIDHSCVDSPCYLNWLGTNGGRNYWLFKKKQSKGISVSVTGEYQPYTPDIENAQGYIFRTGMDATPRLTMGANVPAADIEGLIKMTYSLDVLLLMNPLSWQTDPGGPRWQTARPVPGTFKVIDTDQKTGTIEVTIELPFLNIQSV